VTSVIAFIADPLLPIMYPDAALGMSSFISNPEVVDEEKKRGGDKRSEEKRREGKRVIGNCNSIDDENSYYDKIMIG
jgi:hypothetical protein